jgi:hypothetical protein
VLVLVAVVPVVVLGSPVGCSPGAAGPVVAGLPLESMDIAGKPGGGGIQPPGINGPSGMTRIPAATASHDGQNL